MQARENERRDWIIILLIILLGFLCVIVAGQWAVRFSPRWKLDTNMGSKLNPNSDFLTNIPISNIAPVDPAILTPPSWLASFLTPGATFNTNTPIPTKTNTATATATMPVMETNTPTSTWTSTSTLVVYVTSTSKPAATKTSAPGSTSTPTPTAAPTSTSTPTNIPSSTVTNTPTATSTNTPTNTPTSTPTNTPTNTPTDTPTSTPTDTPTATPTNTPIPVDLSITKDDGVTTYTPGGASLKYIITVTNNSGFAVNGATVTDVFPVQISSASWVCAPSAGAVCWSGSGTGNINDSVNLPAGGSVTYTVNATTSTFAAGTLSNTASVAVPAGFAETAPGNNTSTDSDTSTDTEPDIGPPDGISTNPGTGYPGLTMLLNPAIVANGDVGTPDLVYYEVIFSGSSIALDRVQIEISTDGISWIPVFIWGDNIRDTNTNVDTDILLPDPGCTNDPPECDNRSIPSSELYPPPAGTGITIDIDSIPGVVSGTSYSWIQISSYAGGADGPDIDAIQILP